MQRVHYNNIVLYQCQMMSGTLLLLNKVFVAAIKNSYTGLYHQVCPEEKCE